MPTSARKVFCSSANFATNGAYSACGMKAGTRFAASYIFLYSGCARSRGIACSQALITGSGKPFGPARPRNLRTTMSTPLSLAVGTSGIWLTRASVITASGRTFLPSICERSSCNSPMAMSRVPFSTLIMVSPPPSVETTAARGVLVRRLSCSRLMRSSDPGLAAPQALRFDLAWSVTSFSVLKDASARV